MTVNMLFLCLGLLMFANGVFSGKVTIFGSSKTWTRAQTPWRFWGCMAFWVGFVLFCALLSDRDIAGTEQVTRTDEAKIADTDRGP